MVRGALVVIASACLVAASALGPRAARAQAQDGAEDLTASPAILAKAKSNLEAAESAYAASANQSPAAGGLAGVVAATGGDPGSLDLPQVLANRAAARTQLIGAINADMTVIETRAAHLKQSGEDAEADALLRKLIPLQERLAQLADDAANDEATKNGAPLMPLSVPPGKGGALVGFAPSPTTPATVTTPSTGTPGSAGTPAPGTGSGGIGPANATGTTPAATKRTVTGKVLLVAKADKPEATLAKLDAECDRVRRGDAPSDDELDLPATGVEVWLVEKWKDKRPVRVRLTASADNARAHDAPAAARHDLDRRGHGFARSHGQGVAQRRGPHAHRLAGRRERRGRQAGHGRQDSAGASDRRGRRVAPTASAARSSNALSWRDGGGRSS